MPIVTLQRRVTEVGRIRLGARGANHPRALSTFRFTSPRADLIERAANLFGGTPQAWNEQHEVVTEANTLDVLIPPADVGFSQWLEHWTADGCQRRCDGVREVLHDVPCICTAEAERICKDTTRLSVLLPAFETFGVWRVETHSFYAAMELASAVELALGLAARRGAHLAEGTLRIEQRAVKRPGVPPHRFSVVVLDVSMVAAAVDRPALVASQKASEALSRARHPAGGQDAVAALEVVREEARPEVVPRIPRGADTAPITALPVDTDDVPVLEIPNKDSGQSEEERSRKRMHAAVTKLLPSATREERDALRYVLAIVVTTKTRGAAGQPPAASWNELDHTELARVEGLLTDLKTGAMLATPRDDGGYDLTLKANGHQVQVYKDTNGAWSYNLLV